MPSVVISGYYGFDNWGDEAILEAAAAGLKAAVPGLEITVISNAPAKTTARHGLRAVGRGNVPGIIREIRRTDMLLSGGGSLLQDVTSTRSLWYYLGVIQIAQHFGKKTMIYANGVGPINRPYNRARTRAVLNRVSLITVRGPSSKRFLREIGVTVPRVIETADGAFALEPAPPSRVARVCAAENLPDLAASGGRPFVGLAVRPWPGTETLARTVARAADYIGEKLGYGVLFLPVHRDIDLPVIEYVRSLMRTPSHVLEKTYSAAEIVGLLGRLKWVLSMRLHPLVFAAIGGVPAVGLVYDPKVEDFLDQSGQVSVGPVEKVTLEDILLGLTELEKNYDERVSRLRQLVSDFRARARLNNELAAELLRRP